MGEVMIGKQIREEPVLFQGLIQALLAVLVSFGLKLDASQVGGLLALSAALLSFWTRTQVTPILNPKTNDGQRLVTEQQRGGVAA